MLRIFLVIPYSTVLTVDGIPYFETRCDCLIPYKNTNTKSFISSKIDTTIILTMKQLHIAHFCGRLKPKLGLVCIINRSPGSYPACSVTNQVDKGKRRDSKMNYIN